MINKNQSLYIAGLIVAILIVGTVVYSKNCNSISEAEAISLLKKAYPEFQYYPNDNLPPQTIETEKSKNGWYIAFVQQGSGLPILGAKCFFVENNKKILTIGEFKPSTDFDFSIRTCSNNNK